MHELQGSLRDPDDDELSGRLFSLYGFVGDQLLAATADGDQRKVAAAREVLAPIAEAWAIIAPAPATADAQAVRRAA